MLGGEAAEESIIIPVVNVSNNDEMTTQIEVDLICGGVGFDDGSTDDGQWLKESRDKQKSKVKDKEV